MPTDHFESETQAKLHASSEAVEDRWVINVRREGFLLLESLIGRAKRVEAALSANDTEMLAQLLDHEARHAA